MTNIKSTKRQTMIYKTIQRKLKIEQHEPAKKTLGFRKCKRFCSTSCCRPVIV